VTGGGSVHLTRWVTRDDGLQRGHVAERRAAAPRSPRRPLGRRCTYVQLCELTLSSENRERSHSTPVDLAHRIKTGPAHEIARRIARSGVIAGGWIATSKIKPRITNVHIWKARNPRQRTNPNQITLPKPSHRAPRLATPIEYTKRGNVLHAPPECGIYVIRAGDWNTR
jgi:hypothetical protein